MKITIVQGAFLPVPPLMGGAVEKIWHGLAIEFARLDHEVTHISRQYGELPHRESVLGVEYVRVLGFDTPRSPIHLKMLDLIYALRVRRNLPIADIVVTHTFWLPILVRSRRYGRVYVHAQRYPKGQMRFYRHTARIQTVSSEIARAIVKQAPSAAPLVTVIPNPLPDTAFVTPDRSGQAPIVLYVGRIHPEKGIELLLDAFHIVAQRCDWRLVIVGPWETRHGGGGEDYFSRLAGRRPDLASRTVWVGPVFDPVALADYFRTAALFVYPTRAARGEASPLAPVEAMAAGCPVIVSNLRCFEDYLDAGHNGLTFEVGGEAPARALAEQMLHLIESPHERDRLADQARLTAQRYTMRQVAQQYVSDFDVVLHRIRP